MSKHWKPWWVRRKQDRKLRRDQVRERDGDDCWRCGHPMRFGGLPNCGRAATIEHLVPLANGGTWALENLVLCHKGCNKHLGTNTPDHKERMRIGKARRV